MKLVVGDLMLVARFNKLLTMLFIFPVGLFGHPPNQVSPWRQVKTLKSWSVKLSTVKQSSRAEVPKPCHRLIAYPGSIGTPTANFSHAVSYEPGPNHRGIAYVTVANSKVTGVLDDLETKPSVNCLGGIVVSYQSEISVVKLTLWKALIDVIDRRSRERRIYYWDVADNRLVGTIRFLADSAPSLGDLRISDWGGPLVMHDAKQQIAAFDSEGSVAFNAHIPSEPEPTDAFALGAGKLLLSSKEMVRFGRVLLDNDEYLYRGSLPHLPPKGYSFNREVAIVNDENLGKVVGLVASNGVESIVSLFKADGTLLTEQRLDGVVERVTFGEADERSLIATIVGEKKRINTEYFLQRFDWFTPTTLKKMGKRRSFKFSQIELPLVTLGNGLFAFAGYDRADAATQFLIFNLSKEEVTTVGKFVAQGLWRFRLLEVPSAGNALLTVSPSLDENSAADIPMGLEVFER